MASRLTEFEPRQLSSLLWSAATLGLLIPISLMGQVYKETRPHLTAFPVSEILRPGGSHFVSTTSALYEFGFAPTAWVNRFVTA